jgi:diaminopropionate ammonia-lyase
MREHCQYAFSRWKAGRKTSTEGKWNPPEDSDTLEFHQSIEGYRPTPELSLQALAKEIGVKNLWVKDESERFGLKAFKGLGASYAIYRFLKSNRGDHTFCTATDGNHGKGVAWASAMFKQKAVVFIPKEAATSRIRSIQQEKAEVIVVDGDYGEAVRCARRESEKHGWQLMQDTSWPGYTEIPGLIMAGYTTMFREMEGLLHSPERPRFDFVFLQGGVGSWAASAVLYYTRRYREDRPTIICVEPTAADCLLRSARAGTCSAMKETRATIMAGLNCGTPSLIAWPVLRDGVGLFLSIPDSYAKAAMRLLFFPKGSDPPIVSGESGSAGLGGLLALLTSPYLREPRLRLRIDERSRVLVYNTEGDTDPVGFRKVVEGK